MHLKSSALLLLIPLLLAGQGNVRRPRTNANGKSPANAAAYQGVTVTLRGTLKGLDKKKLEIETEEKQFITVRISNKTKFVRDGQMVKASEIDLGTPVSVDANEDRDLSILAVAVSVNSPREKAGPQ